MILPRTEPGKWRHYYWKLRLRFEAIFHILFAKNFVAFFSVNKGDGLYQVDNAAFWDQDAKLGLWEALLYKCYQMSSECGCKSCLLAKVPFAKCYNKIFGGTLK